MADVGHSIEAQKERLPEQERRGRAFMAVYLTVLSLATLGFVLLVIFVRSEDVISKFDAPIARAIQSVQWPLGGWVLIHTSDLGWHPYDVLCVAVIALTLFALRLRL